MHDDELHFSHEIRGIVETCYLEMLTKYRYK